LASTQSEVSSPGNPGFRRRSPIKVSTQRDMFVAKLSIHFFPCFAFRDFCFGGGRRTGFPLNGFVGRNGCGHRLRRCLIHIFEYVSSHCLFAFSAVISFRTSMGLINSIFSVPKGFAPSFANLPTAKINSKIIQKYKKIRFVNFYSPDSGCVATL
jgi:hypothetical protein